MLKFIGTLLANTLFHYARTVPTNIGANLVDSMYSGIYNGSQKHEADLMRVLERSWNAGVHKIIITGTDLEDSKKAITIAEGDERLFTTVGCHPTNCNQLEQSDGNSYLEQLIDLCGEKKNKVVALGEFGLDFDRLQFCTKTVQMKWFEKQLINFEDVKKPLFLHCRNAFEDLINILSRNRDKFVGGVVHSFDGTSEQANKILDLGLFIGINGCSLRTNDNIKVVKDIPSDRIILETDSPWCEVRPTHPGFHLIETKFESVKKEKWDPYKLVKGRNEPCNIIQILEIISKIKEENKVELCELIYENTEKLYFSGI